MGGWNSCAQASADVSEEAGAKHCFNRVFEPHVQVLVTTRDGANRAGGCMESTLPQQLVR